MFRSSGAVVLVLTLLAVTGPAVAAEATAQKPEMRKAAVAGGARHVRHRADPRYAYGPYGPHYLDRPYFYAPAPNLALAFGFGFGPWW